MDSRSVKGYTLGVIAAATYGLNPLFALPLMNCGIDAPSVLFFRYLLAIPVVALMIIARGRTFRVTMPQLGMLAVFGLLMGFSSVFLFESYNYMDVGIASTLLFIYPLMVALLMATFFRERIKPLTWLCLAAAMSGIGLLYNGPDGATLSLVGMALVAASALAYALYIVGINRSGLSQVATLTVTFYVLLFGVGVFAVDLAIKGHIAVPTEPWMWGNVAALAVLPTVISFLCTTAAIAAIGSTPTAILGALEPVTAVIVGIFAFGETLGPTDIAGLILIIAAVTVVVAADPIQQYIVAIRRLFPRLRIKRK